MIWWILGVILVIGGGFIIALCLLAFYSMTKDDPNNR